MPAMPRLPAATATALPRPDHLVQRQLRELPFDRARHVRRPWRVEPLADAEHAWAVDDVFPALRGRGSLRGRALRCGPDRHRGGSSSLR